MSLILSLIFFPLLIGLILLISKNERVNSIIVRGASIVIIALSIIVCVTYFSTQIYIYFSKFEWLNYIILAIEALMTIYIVYIGVKKRSFLVIAMSIVQVGLVIWFELSQGHNMLETATLNIDKFSLLMILIIGIIGSLICIYSVSYFRDYHEHHAEFKDRRNIFFSVMFIFLAAMFGLVVSNNMLWMLLFWEVTSFCSFLLIGYSKENEAVKNALKALTINVGGGLAFTAGIIIIGMHYHVIGMNNILNILADKPVLYIAVFLMGVAGLTKSAQMPFSGWLLGAMVAPTPSSALLHSSTMVKAGVFLFIRLSPLLYGNYVGAIFMIAGAFTFIITAMLAVSQTDAKKLLAYSTISNLGLMIVCASIGTAEALWAAIMLIVFHAIAKSLLFLSVGTVAHKIESRDIENMDGLIKISQSLTICLIIGIAGMFLAPFGMLISKWAAMKAFIDSGNMLIVLVVAFGSSITLFFWTKWMGKLVENVSRNDDKDKITINFGEKIVLYIQAILVVVVCLGFPVISSGIVTPYLNQIFYNVIPPIQGLDTTVIIMMMCILFLLGLVLTPIYRKRKVGKTSLYMAGENTGDNRSFYGSMGSVQEVESENWYLNNWFGEGRLWKFSIAASCCILIIGAFFGMGVLL